MFIVFEGIDGSGKTTHARRLAERIAEGASHRETLFTREPGGWDGGGSVRSMLLNASFSHILSQFFLFMFDRCEHAARVITPALDRGAVVISDRYTPSTMAYQVLSNADLDDDQKRALLALPSAARFPEPNVVVWLDLPADAAASRVSSRGKLDAIEGRGVEWYERVRGAYEAMFDADGGATWIKIDASLDEDAVFDQIVERISWITGERI